MGWRQTLRAIHRDAGYVAAPLTILFALSGIAVNHIDAWNPSYARTTEPLALGPLTGADVASLEREVVARAGIDPSEVTGRRRSSPQKFTVFLQEGGEATVDPTTGGGTLLRVTPRTGLFEANVLHLNHLKGVWTYVSDAFAVVLVFFAVSGLVLNQGRTGLEGRGKWFLAGGLAIPVAFVAVYHATR